MANYGWEGLNKDGVRESGTVNAADEKEVRRTLRGRGVRVKKITPPSFLEFDIGEWLVARGFAKAFGPRELMTFTKQLAIMTDAGVPIIQALEILFKSERNASLKNAVKTISIDVGEGKTLAEAMGKQKGFDRLYCNLVKAGEAGGILDEILRKLGEHMDRAEKIKAQIKSAMTYPAIVVFVGLAVIWGLMTFVVPQFVEMLKDSGQEPPFITQLVIDTSNFIQEYSLIGIPGMLVGVVLLQNYIKTTTGKIAFDNFMMRLPVFGPIVVKGNLASFCRTMSTLLSSGVSLIDSLEICVETIDNGVVANDLKTVRKAIEQGKTLTEPLSKIDYFPDMVSQMIRVGEQTGRVDSMLEKVAEVFEEEVNNLVTNMTKLIEPFIIVFLGGMVATVLVAMYLPIFMSAGGN
ncbi:MAG: pilus assembly protein PilC [Bdellovibrionales bacterium CG22_combo_CG10-13_8_21_14_all_38_13]|nr:MAG: pilus assembly protein PilC [Bdellovibrionales bacterium CG22_combo_CG10-13_8_21_14_all_38_13]